MYDQYAGHYWNEEVNATLIIAREGNHLTGKAEEEGLQIELVPQPERIFFHPIGASRSVLVRVKMDR